MSERLSLAVASLFLLAPTVALGQVDEDVLQQARARFEAGEAAYESGDAAAALDAFTEAHAMMEGHPNQGMILFNIARCQDDLGQHAEAIASYRRFLEEAPQNAPNRNVALERITLLEARVSEAPAETAATTEATPDATATTTGGGGGGIHPVGPILIGVGGAAILAGAIIGAYGLAERGDVLSQCDGTVCPPEVEARAAELETLGIAADALLWPGIVIAAAGAVLTIVLTEDGADTEVACGPLGCNVRGRF